MHNYYIVLFSYIFVSVCNICAKEDDVFTIMEAYPSLETELKDFGDEFEDGVIDFYKEQWRKANFYKYKINIKIIDNKGKTLGYGKLDENYQVGHIFKYIVLDYNKIKNNKKKDYQAMRRILGKEVSSINGANNYIIKYWNISYLDGDSLYAMRIRIRYSSIENKLILNKFNSWRHEIIQPKIPSE